MRGLARLNYIFLSLQKKKKKRKDENNLAQLKNLIVNGASRFLTPIKGDLSGTSDYSLKMKTYKQGSSTETYGTAYPSRVRRIPRRQRVSYRIRLSYSPQQDRNAAPRERPPVRTGKYRASSFSQTCIQA